MKINMNLNLSVWMRLVNFAIRLAAKCYIVIIWNILEYAYISPLSACRSLPVGGCKR